MSSFIMLLYLHRPLVKQSSTLDFIPAWDFAKKTDGGLHELKPDGLIFLRSSTTLEHSKFSPQRPRASRVKKNTRNVYYRDTLLLLQGLRRLVVAARVMIILYSGLPAPLPGMIHPRLSLLYTTEYFERITSMKR